MAAPKKQRQPSEILAAVAVAVIAFWAPAEETGFLLRLIGSVVALACLLVAEVGLESILASAEDEVKKPKANPFEVVVRKVDVPTAPPGGVFGAACSMSEHLKDFPISIGSRVTSNESGFQVLTGNEKLRVKVLAGNAIGWEHGSQCWLAKRDEWIKAVQAAPRCKQVMETAWMGVTSLSVIQPPAPVLEAGVTVVRIDGVEKKPALNGKLAAVTRAANEVGRVGVRPEGQKESLLLLESKLEPLPAFDSRGVSLPCLRSLFAELEPLVSGLTLAEAIDSVIKPLTHSCRASVAVALAKNGAKDEAGKPYVAPATVLLCCSPSAKASDVYDVLHRYASGSDDVAKIYVWLDLLCTNHHAADDVHELPMMWWQTTYKAALKSIGAMCTVLHPWDEPAPLRDSWCHWQLHCAISVEAKLHFEVTTTESAKLDAALVEDLEAPMKLIDTRVDGWKTRAEAPTPEQRAKTEKAIEKADGGYDEFGRKLADILHKWLLDRAKGVLEALPKEERATSTLVDRVAKLLQDFGDLKAAEPLCREQVELRSQQNGETHSDTLEAINNLALLLHQLGKLEEAEPYSKRKLAGCRATLGDRHPDTVTAIDTTSQLLSDLGKLGEALPLKRESLAEKRRTLGDRHPDTLLSVNNLAVLLNDLGRQTQDLRMLREAEPLKREALAGCREVLGNRHPHTLASVAGLADLLMQLAPADPRAVAEAEPLAREALAGSREVLGNSHPETLKSVGMMATLLVEMGHLHPPNAPERARAFKEAEPLYKEAVVGFARGLGQYHPTPLSYAHELSRLQLDMAKEGEAERGARETVSGCRAALGDSHPETLLAITHLAAVLRQRKSLDEAVKLASEVHDGWKVLERDAKVPRNTLTASNILAELLHTMGRNDEALPLCREVLNGFLRAVGPQHPFSVSAAENLSNVLRARKEDDEADKVLKQFGMKTPLQGIGEGDEGAEVQDDTGGGGVLGVGKAPTSDKAAGGAKAAKSKSANGKAKAALSLPSKAIEEAVDVD